MAEIVLFAVIGIGLCFVLAVIFNCLDLAVRWLKRQFLS